MGLKELLASFKRKWWLIVLLVLLGGSVGYLSNLYSKPVYEAQTVLCVMQNAAAEPLSEGDLVLGQYMIQQYAQIISSRTVTSAILNNLKNLNISENQLRAMIKTAGSKESNVFIIGAEAADPNIAATVANATAQEFINSLNKLTNYKNIGVLDRATPPAYPNQNKTQAIFLGALLGFMISLSIIFILEYFNTKIRSAEDIENSLNLQVIGIIPDHNIR